MQKKKVIVASAVCLAMGLAVPAARAQSPAAAARRAATEPPTTKWDAGISVGWDPSLSGGLVSASSGQVAGVPIALGDQSYSDVFGSMVNWRFYAGYMFSPRNEATFTFGYESASADPQAAGVGLGTGIVAQYDDFSEKLFEVGYRYHFAAVSSRVHPYAGISGGFARIGAINATLTTPSTGTAGVVTLPLYDNSTVGSLGLHGGVIYNVTGRVGITGELALRWHGGLSTSDALVGTGFDNIDKDSGRWSLPITFGALVRF
jgi:hypothetical protein